MLANFCASSLDPVDASVVTEKKDDTHWEVLLGKLEMQFMRVHLMQSLRE